jgi:hypothetical protein
MESSQSPVMTPTNVAIGNHSILVAWGDNSLACSWLRFLNLQPVKGVSLCTTIGRYDRPVRTVTDQMVFSVKFINCYEDTQNPFTPE